jgi:hypothetical protein
VSPDSMIGSHKHGNNQELYFVLSGWAEVTIDSKAVTASRSLANATMTALPTPGYRSIFNWE